jgi:hypothetical protein
VAADGAESQRRQPTVLSTGPQTRESKRSATSPPLPQGFEGEEVGEEEGEEFVEEGVEEGVEDGVEESPPESSVPTATTTSPEVALGDADGSSRRRGPILAGSLLVAALASLGIWWDTARS